jgi:tyrosyl-tRNA synthetase
MTLSEELTWRGFVNQMTFKDITALDKEPITFYWGVDPSANSMTVGNLAAAIMVRHFIDHGHKAVLLVGGATGLIGDPDGKKQERDLKQLDVIEENVRGIISQYKTVFSGQHFDIVNNHDWFKDIGYLWFLRNIGKNLSMTQLLDREFVQSRIGEGGAGISYAEFSYALIQGYDFLHLYREKGVTLQVCGADQWGNSLAGVEMIRKLEGGEAHVYSTPLIINKTTGVKFGKSEDGAIWLDEAQTSVYKFYQFWLNIDDASVVELLKIYTLLSKAEIDALEVKLAENPSAREAQKALAHEVTTLVHGKERAEAVESVTGVLFGGHSIHELDSKALDELAKEIPTTSDGKLIDILTQTGLVASSSEARRLLEGGGIQVNGEKVDGDSDVTSPSLIKKGKNGFALVR